MSDNQVTINAKTFDFHYVTKSTGEIDGLSFFQQTEDALNDIGQLAQEAYNRTVVSNEQVQQALSIANTANNNASNALTTANKASNDVATLTITVTEISQQAQSAVSTSQSALQNSNQALSQSQQAVTTSNEAKSIAQKAVTDTSAAEQRINQAAQTTEENAQAAQNSEQGALNAQTQAEAASQSAQNSVELSQKWAIWLGDGASEDETVDGTDYSAKWWAQHAEEVVNDVVHISAQTLTEAQQTQVLTNLGVIDALEDLITEYGGTVPTSLSENSIQTMSTEGNSDPWADLE